MVRRVIMNVLTRKGVTLAILVVIGIVGLIADMLTINQLGGHLWDLSRIGTRNEEMKPLTQVTPELPTIVPTSSPTPIPPLEEQLKDALAVSGSSSKNMALFKVVQHAVLLTDYWTAIRAADASPGSTAQSESLSFVVNCAIEDGKYNVASEAAARISYTSIRDQMRNKVIDARKSAQSVQIQSLASKDRTQMACFDQ